MQKLRTTRGFLAGLFLITIVVEVLAHGDVTPHAVDTSSLKPIGTEWAETNPYRGDAKAATVGALGYLQNCAGCHGLNAESGGVASDLLKYGKECLEMGSKSLQDACMKEGDGYFKDITLHGKKNSDGRYTMPAYGAVFTQEAVWAVKAYIDARTIEDMAKSRK